MDDEDERLVTEGDLEREDVGDDSMMGSACVIVLKYMTSSRVV